MTLDVPTASYLIDPDADVATVLDALRLATRKAGEPTVLPEPTGPVAGARLEESTSVDVGGVATQAPDGTGQPGAWSAEAIPAAAPAGREPPADVVVVVDTADRLVRAAGLELVATTDPRHLGGLGPGTVRSGAAAAATGTPRPGPGEVLLVLRGQPGEPPLRAVVPQARRYLIPDLPAGPLRDRLAPIVEIRALLPIVEVHRRELTAAVRNRDGKIVVRLGLTRLAARPAEVGTAAGLLPPPASGEPVRLPTRVEVSGVLGYPKPFARVQEVLTTPPFSLPEASETVADEAVTALGGIPQGLTGKIEVGLRPDDRADLAALRILRSLAHVVESNLPGTLDDLDTEFLHDLRVAVRKSRSVLRELKRAFEPEARQAQADALRWVQAVTGPTRDLDVQLLEWDDIVAHLPDERRQHLDPVRELLRQRRAEALAALVETLEGDGFRQRWSAWRAFLASDPRGLGPEDGRPDAARPVQEVAARRIRKVYERMVRMGEAIDDTSPAQALHDLRKRGKELRYLLELFGGLWPQAKIKPLVSKLKGLQNVLGLHQDREVQAHQLRLLAPELTMLPEGGAQALLAMGSLVDGLEHQQHEARDRFAEWFDAFTGAELPR